MFAPFIVGGIVFMIFVLCVLHSQEATFSWVSGENTGRGTYVV